jgi:hypothetical protein
MKKKPIPQLIYVGLLCLFMCSINSCNRKVYPVTSDEQSLDGHDAANGGRYTFNDKDTVVLSGFWPVKIIKGSTYNAINPKYIANTYGATEEVFPMIIYNKPVKQKNFKLIGPNLRYNNSYLTTGNAAKTWNYVVDSINMVGYGREVVSALMLDAIEKVQFITPPVYEFVGITGWLRQDTLYRSRGEVLFQTRHIPGESIETRDTRYLLDSAEITYKIFNALNPVFIRSLERITDKTKIAELGYDNCNELVRVNLFTLDEVIAPEKLDKPDSYNLDEWLVIIDGVPMNPEIVRTLSRRYFKTINRSVSRSDVSYPQYAEKYPEKSKFLIITL